jgi:hypothetical protein
MSSGVRALRYHVKYFSLYSIYSDSCTVLGELFSMTNRWSIFSNAEVRHPASTSLTIDLRQMEISELRNATKGKEPNLLDMMVKTSVPEREEVIVDHIIHPLDQDLIHLLQKVVTRDIPLLDRYLDESLRDNVQ